MCDSAYMLTRPAKVAETLVSTKFSKGGTRGFSAHCADLPRPVGRRLTFDQRNLTAPFRASQRVRHHSQTGDSAATGDTRNACSAAIDTTVTSLFIKYIGSVVIYTVESLPVILVTSGDRGDKGGS